MGCAVGDAPRALRDELVQSCELINRAYEATFARLPATAPQPTPTEDPRRRLPRATSRRQPAGQGSTPNLHGRQHRAHCRAHGARRRCCCAGTGHQDAAHRLVCPSRHPDRRWCWTHDQAACAGAPATSPLSRWRCRREMSGRGPREGPKARLRHIPARCCRHQRTGQGRPGNVPFRIVTQRHISALRW